MAIAIDDIHLPKIPLKYAVNSAHPIVHTSSHPRQDFEEFCLKQGCENALGALDVSSIPESNRDRLNSVRKNTEMLDSLLDCWDHSPFQSSNLQKIVSKVPRRVVRSQVFPTDRREVQFTYHRLNVLWYATPLIHPGILSSVPCHSPPTTFQVFHFP